jgi:hypothetical protein
MFDQIWSFDRCAGVNCAAFVLNTRFLVGRFRLSLSKDIVKLFSGFGRVVGIFVRRWWQIFSGIGALVLVSGCATNSNSVPGFAIQESAENRETLLAQDLAALAPSAASEAEARDLARIALETANGLRARWRPVGSALLNNLLVNMRYRERGLCYQWTNDLLEPLEAREFRHFDLYWGTAFWGDRLREHNAVVVTARGRPFSEGLVLDSWRFGGRLIWIKVRADLKYPWRELTPAELVQFRPLARP